jgi:hypothetical protein
MDNVGTFLFRFRWGVLDFRGTRLVERGLRCFVRFRILLVVSGPMDSHSGYLISNFVPGALKAPYL